jgi:hypothetical protein
MDANSYTIHEPLRFDYAGNGSSLTIWGKFDSYQNALTTIYTPDWSLTSSEAAAVEIKLIASDYVTVYLRNLMYGGYGSLLNMHCRGEVTVYGTQFDEPEGMIVAPFATVNMEYVYAWGDYSFEVYTAQPFVEGKSVYLNQVGFHSVLQAGSGPLVNVGDGHLTMINVEFEGNIFTSGGVIVAQNTREVFVDTLDWHNNICQWCIGIFSITPPESHGGFGSDTFYFYYLNFTAPPESELTSALTDLSVMSLSAIYRTVIIESSSFSGPWGGSVVSMGMYTHLVCGCVCMFG